MRKVSKKRKYWLIINQPRIEDHRANRKKKGPYIPSLIKTVRTQCPPMQIDLPPEVNFEMSYPETINVFNFIRKASGKQIWLKYLNFDLIQRISPEAALVLAAEIDRWNASFENKITARTANWNIEVKRLLIEMGFFKLMKINDPVRFGPPDRPSVWGFGFTI